MSSETTRDLTGLVAGLRRRLARVVRTGRARLEDLAPVPDQAPAQPLFIHFGTHKTGSSSIQDTLYRNDGRSFGYDYPDLGSANGSLALSGAFRDAEALMTRRLVPSLEIAARRKERELGRLRTLLASAPRHLPKVLSAEEIAHFKPAELEALDRFVSGYLPERIYLGYVREPVSYMRSAYQETLKRSLPAWHILDPAAPAEALRLRSHQTVDRLDALVGRERVRAFAFDRSGFPGGDVVRHFLQQIGAQEAGMTLHHSNESLTLLAVKLLYLFRSRTAAEEVEAGQARSLGPFIDSLKALGGAEFRLHPDIVARIVKANQQVYRWSAARLDRPLTPPAAEHDGGVRRLVDLEQLTGDELAIFSDLLGQYGLSLPAHPDADALGQAMLALRQSFAARFAKAPPRAKAQPPKARAAKAPAAKTPAAQAAPAVARGGGSGGGAARPRLLLHIGMGKTGTTAIQHFCWANRRALKQAGVTYPGMGQKDGAHHRLSPHVPPSLAKTWDFIDPAVWAPRLAAEATQPVLLSSELISSAGRDTIRRTATILQQHFDVRILIYVRRIDDSIMASYNQTVKGGVQRLPIEEALSSMYERLRIDKVVPAWTEAFGAANVTVRPYDRSQFPGGDILRDFCALIGIAWSDAFDVPAQNPNSRLDRSALEFKRCLNVVIPDPLISVKFNPGLLDYSARRDQSTTAIFSEATLLPGAVRRMLIARQDSYYRELAKGQPGLQDGSLFGANLPQDVLDWSPLSLTKAEFDAVGQAVLGFRQRQILRAQIDAARRSDDPQRLLYAARFVDLA